MMPAEFNSSLVHVFSNALILQMKYGYFSLLKVTEYNTVGI
jgi:hypothetical protein